ncbi:MAG: ATPase domain-containing protein [archaeon]
MSRVKTGIEGLDEILKGGFNENSSILVTGAPGTGKSILALQFIYQGCLNKEPCLYISCEETVDMIKSYAQNIGLNFDDFEKKGIMHFLKENISVSRPVSIAKAMEIIKTKKIKRVVLDSLTYFEYAAPSELEFRKSLLQFMDIIRDAKVTALVVSQENTPSIDLINYKAQDFLFDGLVLLAKIRKGESFERCINVVKMRGQEHLLNIFPFLIDKGGIKVYTKQVPFSLK